MLAKNVGVGLQPDRLAVAGWPGHLGHSLEVFRAARTGEGLLGHARILAPTLPFTRHD